MGFRRSGASTHRLVSGVERNLSELLASVSLVSTPGAGSVGGVSLKENEVWVLRAVKLALADRAWLRLSRTVVKGCPRPGWRNLPWVCRNLSFTYLCRPGHSRASMEGGTVL
ncbi:MAG: hypothetical protein ACREX9_03475 [Gammaproteobacteria bacterium]